jgi:alpha-L-rhamnosidase
VNYLNDFLNCPIKKSRVKLIFKVLLLMFLTAPLPLKPALGQTVQVTAMQCEHLIDPLGLDNLHPRLSWRTFVQQKTYTLIASTDSIALAKNQLASLCWLKTGRAEQLLSYQGRPLRPFTRYYWKVTINGQIAVSAIAAFETGPLSMSDWQGDWITDTKDINLKSAPFFSKTFAINRTIKSARLYMACGGLYELSLNGEKVGDHILDPMFTRYDRRNLFVTYDVTKQFQRGSNTIDVLLGNGWYNHQSTAVWFYDKAPWRQRPRFCLDLRITYADGTTETISTDKTWRTALSSITLNSIYTGEHSDARLKDTLWKKVIVVHAPSEHIVAQALYPIRDCEKLNAVVVRKFNDSDYVFDIGRNIAGVTEITINGAPGTVIRLKHAERLDSLGHIDQSNIDYHYRPMGNGDPFQTDVYTLDSMSDTFRPHFNYKGFRYVEVSSSSSVNLRKESLVAYFDHSDVPVVGAITSSDALITQLWRATNNSYLSNLFGYPTDCPQREKNGWTGDAHAAVETGLYNFDAITVYEKWLADVRDAQQPNGTISAIVPTSDWGYDHHNGPDWVSGIAIIPWDIYQFYGDSKALADNYEAIKRYVNLLNRRFPNYLCNWGLGDWVPIKSFAPVEFTSTVFYYQDALILAKTAKLFGKKQDFIFYSALAQKIKTAFNQKYLQSDGNYDQGYQTELSFALYYHLTPENVKAQTATLLAKAVQTGGVHLDVGLLGSKTILPALSDNGYADCAYQLATLKTYPSWAYWMTQGMTTLPEEWDIGPKSDGSLNHIMFGSISAWFYSGLGGIQADEQEPGFKHILLRPHIPAGLDSFSAEHQSPCGTIKSGWKTENGRITYTATIPPNSTAELELTVHGVVQKHANLIAGTYHYELTINSIHQ